MNLGLAVKERALAIGFDLAGIAPLEVWEDLEFSRRWTERGFGGEMHYLKNPKRYDPRQVLPSAKSVVCVSLIYNAPLPYSTDAAGASSPEPRGWISRYAWGEDYHRVMKEKLEHFRAEIERLAPGAETRVHADTGPLVERAFARYSGIGWMGKNTCLINEKKGSWFFLGVVLTSLDLEPDPPAADRCGSCTRCIEACPTGALVEPYVMDASRCIAYFTIELKGSIPEEFRPAIGNNVFGCDICQDVCPWNRKDRGQGLGSRGQQSVVDNPSSDVKCGSIRVATTQASEFQPLQIDKNRGQGQGTRGQQINMENSIEAAKPQATDKAPATPNQASSSGFRVSAFDSAFSLFNPLLADLASLSEEDFRRVFAHSPVKRAKYQGWLRNLCVAMGNSGDERFVPWLERAREQDNPVIREHADWALARLCPGLSCSVANPRLPPP